MLNALNQQCCKILVKLLAPLSIRWHRCPLVYTSPTMFCPQCRAEYRPGFTQCTDCEVALVHEDVLAAAGYRQVRKSELAGKLSCTLWRGKDPHFYLELIGDLAGKNVPCFGTPVNPPRYDSFEQQPAGSYSIVEFEVLVSEENLSFAQWILSSAEELQGEQRQEGGANDSSQAAEESDVSPDVVGICPLCLSEFTTTCAVCPNCGVPLRPPQRGCLEQDPAKALCRLPHPQFLADLRMGLQHAGIPFNNANFPHGPEALRSDVSVLSSDFDRATRVLAQVLQYWEFDRTVNFGPSRDPREPYWPHRATNKGWFPEDLGSLLWEGSNLNALEGIGMALREHQIAYQVASPKLGTARVFIHPEDEQPAREVLRYVLEGAFWDCVGPVNE